MLLRCKCMLSTRCLPYHLQTQLRGSEEQDLLPKLRPLLLLLFVLNLTVDDVAEGAVGAAFLLMRTDIRDSSRMLQRNMKTIRAWLEESQSAASTCGASGSLLGVAG